MSLHPSKGCLDGRWSRTREEAKGLRYTTLGTPPYNLAVRLGELVGLSGYRCRMSRCFRYIGVAHNESNVSSFGRLFRGNGSRRPGEGYTKSPYLRVRIYMHWLRCSCRVEVAKL